MDAPLEQSVHNDVNNPREEGSKDDEPLPRKTYHHADGSGSMGQHSNELDEYEVRLNDR